MLFKPGDRVKVRERYSSCEWEGIVDNWDNPLVKPKNPFDRSAARYPIYIKNLPITYLYSPYYLALEGELELLKKDVEGNKVQVTIRNVQSQDDLYCSCTSPIIEQRTASIFGAGMSQWYNFCTSCRKEVSNYAPPPPEEEEEDDCPF